MGGDFPAAADPQCVVCGHPVVPAADADAPCGAACHSEDCYHIHLGECDECRDALGLAASDDADIR